MPSRGRPPTPETGEARTQPETGDARPQVTVTLDREVAQAAVDGWQGHASHPNRASTGVVMNTISGALIDQEPETGQPIPWTVERTMPESQQRREARADERRRIVAKIEGILAPHSPFNYSKGYKQAIDDCLRVIQEGEGDV